MTRSKTKEHSVPAGNKREGCQRPHSSELTHSAIHDTHMHTQSSFIYPPLCFFSPLHPNPFPVFTIFALPLSVSFPLYIIFESLTHFHGDPTADKDSFTVSQFRHILSSPRLTPAARRHSGKCNLAINNLSSFCKNVISSCRASCYESRMS